MLVFFSVAGHAQDRMTVTGKVIAGDSAIVGATVQVKGGGMLSRVVRRAASRSMFRRGRRWW
ncbi:hypothetical protein ACQ86N_28345 [Puia sp. P3]|uniref:hypothetical protein n=1 Tax=Puia sp. P3 TaxID=3423952 RepID=UPI003D66EEEC